MLKRDSREIRRTMRVLGVHSNGTYEVQFLVYCAVLLFLIFNSISYVVYNWDDTGKRMDGMKAVVLYYLNQSIVFVITRKWDNVRSLWDIIEERFYEVPSKATKERTGLEKRTKDQKTRMITTWCYLLDLILLFSVLPPIFMLLFYIMKDGTETLDIDILHLPLPFHFPKPFKTLPVYILALVLETFFFLQGTRTGILVGVAPFVSMLRVVGDLQLLRFSVNELNNISSSNHVNQLTMNNHEDSINEETNSFLVYIVKQQQHLYRKAGDISRKIQHISFVVETGMAAFICTSIYRVTQSDELVVKIQEAFFSAALIYCIYCYHAMGEEVSTEDENIRQAFYQISWTDKPKEFKKCIFIILTRMTKKLEMKRTGIFTLNLQRFLMTVQAAYSLFNIANNLTN